MNDTIIKFLPHYNELPYPHYMTKGSSGIDLYAAIPKDTEIILHPFERKLIPTGITLSIPPKYEGQIRPRSGLANNYGITILNNPGTIDNDYTGEIKVLLINLGFESFTVLRGMRIAQLVFSKVLQVPLYQNPNVIRQDRGFGSTGV